MAKWQTRFWTSPWTTRAVFAAGVTPLLVLAWKWTHNGLGINRLEYVARYTGSWTLLFLIYTLCITPLRALPGLAPLVKFRRMVGLLAFLYGLLHVLHYLWLDRAWDSAEIIADFTLRRFFIAGAVAFLAMIPLAATSTDAAVRWLGGPRWRRLHRLVYLSAAAGALHFHWQEKYFAQRPLLYATAVALLILWRPAAWWWQRRAAGARGGT